MAILGSNQDGSGAIVVGSAGVGAALVHQSPQRLCLAILGSFEDGSGAILVGSAGVGAALLDLKVPHLVSQENSLGSRNLERVDR